MVGRHHKTQYTRINPSVVFARTGDSGSILLSSNFPLFRFLYTLLYYEHFQIDEQLKEYAMNSLYTENLPQTEQKLTFHHIYILSSAFLTLSIFLSPFLYSFPFFYLKKIFFKKINL